VVTGARGAGPGEPAPGERLQFERVGYFCVDSKADNRTILRESRSALDGHVVTTVNRTRIGLKDSWAAKQGK
jgi:hypothetical protein